MDWLTVNEGCSSSKIHGISIEEPKLKSYNLYPISTLSIQCQNRLYLDEDTGKIVLLKHSLDLNSRWIRNEFTCSIWKQYHSLKSCKLKAIFTTIYLHIPFFPCFLKDWEADLWAKCYILMDPPTKSKHEMTFLQQQAACAKTTSSHTIYQKAAYTHLKFIIEGMIPYMTHIIPLLHNAIVDRIRYI